MGAGNRAEASRLRHLHPARVAQLAGVRRFHQERDRDHPRAAGEGGGHAFLSAAADAYAEYRPRPLAGEKPAPARREAFSDHSLHDRDRHMAETADAIAQIAAEIVARKRAPWRSPPAAPLARLSSAPP